MHASYVKPFSPKSDQKQYSTIKIQPIDTNAYTIHLTNMVCYGK